MPGRAIAAGFAAALGLVVAGTAGAQGFGQVTFGTAPATPAADAAKPPGKNLEGVTVTGKKQAEADKDPNEVLCHSEAVIGSLFPKKVCGTRREIAERRQHDQEVTDAFHRSPIIGVQPH